MLDAIGDLFVLEPLALSVLETWAISVTAIVGVCVIGVRAEGAVCVGHCDSGCWSLIQSALQERDSIGVVAVGLGTVLLLLLLLLLRWLERCNPSVGRLVVGSVVVGFRQGRRCSKDFHWWYLSLSGHGFRRVRNCLQRSTRKHIGNGLSMLDGVRVGSVGA